MQSSIDVEAILERIRTVFAARGASSISGLSRAFKTMDNGAGNRKLDPEELGIGMRERGIDLTKAELAALLKYFDKDGDGNINFDEFLAGIRGRLNGPRHDITEKAFTKFDKDGSGFIEASDLKGIYNCSRHPKVMSGEMTEEQALTKFI